MGRKEEVVEVGASRPRSIGSAIANDADGRRRRNRDYEIRAGDAPKVTSVAAAYEYTYVCTL